MRKAGRVRVRTRGRTICFALWSKPRLLFPHCAGADSAGQSYRRRQRV
ncbi:hypothetical protein [Lysobacter gummosus]